MATTLTAIYAPEKMVGTVHSSLVRPSASDVRSRSAECWPRIALVTPVFNSGEYVEATIESVLSQKYPNLDYFIVDGGSTDGTVDVIRKYEGQISGWISEPDKGMYDALNKGFARTQGEAMGWISATDVILPGGLGVVGGVFRDLPDVAWITGRPTWIDDAGETIKVGELPRWSRMPFLAGYNRYIQQESTYWKRSLWDKAGGYVDASRRMCSDFELWVRFFRHAMLYSVDARIGGFRSHEASLGLQNLEECHRIQEEIVEAELAGMPRGKTLKLWRMLNSGVKGIPVARYAWWRLVEQPLLAIQGQSRTRVIEYRGSPEPGWCLR
jgi:glycosyltransferase involved in cell wall biosynthesis